MPSPVSEFDEAYDDPIREPRTLSEEVLKEPVRRLDPRTPIALSPDATVAEAVTAMNDGRTGCVLVVENERLAGIFTERDIVRRICAGGEALDTLRLGDFMTAAPDTLELDDPIAFVLNLMSVGGYRHVPLVDDDGRPVGVVSVRDVVRFLVDHFPKRIHNLPPSPKGPSSEFPPHGAG
jgi:CBS domain-containing protein